jgi:chromatin structure-remodeling complex subunit RSC1/2
MYQQLMTSNPPKFPATFSPNYFSSIAAGPGTAKPLNSTDPMDDGKTIVTSSELSAEDRIFTEEVWYKGSKYAAGDWIHLANPDDPMRPIVGQIFKTWISDGG